MISVRWQREFSVTVESEVPENNIKQSQATDGIKPQLRTVDLNLLTVFDAVMQEQNITRAAQGDVQRRIIRSLRTRDSAYCAGIPALRLYSPGSATGAK